MAKKSRGEGIVEEPVTIRQLVGLAEATQILQAMLIDALRLLDQDMEVPVTKSWFGQYSRVGSIKIGKGCECGGRLTERGVRSGPKKALATIKIGRDC